ncbi:MAG: PepSY domain-containing protein [Tistlia sp.]
MGRRRPAAPAGQRDRRRPERGDRVLAPRYPIHIGDFAGPVVRALWVIVALLPAAFVVSGLWLHLDRRSRARAGRRTRRAEAAASRA